MELIIDIDEKMYEKIMHGYVPLGLSKYLMKGIPLPKGHGRLIDADELHDDFIDGTEGYDCQCWNRIEIGEIIDNAPTIIEADKEQTDGRDND